MKKFWGGLPDNFKIDPDSLFRFLNLKGFFTYKPKDSSTSILVKVKDKIVKQDSELIILLSPHMYKGGPVPAGVKVKYDEITKVPWHLLDSKKRSKKTEGIDTGVDVGRLSAGQRPNAGQK